MVANRSSFQEISQLIENQFPAIYREEGPMLVAFLTAYYEYLENAEKSSYNEGRKLLESADIDTTMEGFLDHFKTTYLDGFPYSPFVDTRFLIKHVMDYYRTRGTIQSTKLLMKLLFGDEVEVYFPGADVLKPSDSTWKRPLYIEVSTSERTKEYIDKLVTGSVSGATAFVDSIVRKRVTGKMIDIIYISTVKGTFITGDIITDDPDNYKNAPVSIGSFSYFDIESGGRNNKIGDVFDVHREGGRAGKVRVTSTEDATGRVDFKMVNGGHGYSQDDNTQIYVSNTVLTVSNPDQDFIDLESVYQKLEKINILSAQTLNTVAELGDEVVGYDFFGTTVAKGVLVSIAKTGPTNTANSALTVDVTFGSFLDQINLNLSTTPSKIKVGDYIDEEAKAVLSLTANDQPIAVGQSIEQYVYNNPEKDYVVSYAVGKIESIAGTQVTINSYWGELKTGNILVNGNFNALIGSVVTTEIPASASVSAKTGNTVSISDARGAFTQGYKIRSRLSRAIYTISTVTDQGASDLRLTKNAAANGVIDTTEDVEARGIVVGQSAIDVGIFGSNKFFVSNTYSTTLHTDRVLMISPPRDANLNIIEKHVPMTAKSTGQSASFKIGEIVNEQTVTVGTDMLDGVNIANTQYLNIRLNGENSGVNRVGSFVVNSGGTGYVNSTMVTLTGGGYAGGDPYFFGNGRVTTNANGTITAVTVIDLGSGYYETPNVVLPSTQGTVANVSVVMRGAYGFPKSPSGNTGSIIQDCLTFDRMTVGTIATLKSINPGRNYNYDPYVKVRNSDIFAYRRGNFEIILDSITGTFQAGEEVFQMIGTERFDKGTVLEYDVTRQTLRVERDYFETDFNPGYPIRGSITGSSGNWISIIPVKEEYWGGNAEITGKVIAANGVITGVEVISSGYGYSAGPGELESNTNLFTVSGQLRLGKHGIGEGFWTTTTSHLNSEKKIHDNDYYQEFSYDIISSISMDRYVDIIKQVTHVAGTKQFGTIADKSLNKQTGRIESSIEIS